MVVILTILTIPLGWSSKQPGIQIRLHLGTPRRPGDEDPVELQIEGKVTVIPARNPTNVIAYSVAWAWGNLEKDRGCRFLVPLIGGRWYIITQLAVYTTYIPHIANWGIIYGTYHLWGNQETPLTKIVDLLYPPSQDAIVISRILRKIIPIFRRESRKKTSFLWLLLVGGGVDPTLCSSKIEWDQI